MTALVKVNRVILAYMFLLASACLDNTTTSQKDLPKTSVDNTGPEIKTPAQIKEKPSRRAECMKALEKIPKTPLSRDLSAYFESLPNIVLEVRIVPVVYWKAPAQTKNAAAAKAFASIAKASRPRRATRNVVKHYQKDKVFLREIFLRQGYLFATEAHVATAMVQELVLADLFDESAIYLYRGGKIHELERKDNEYFGNGKEPYKLLLNDRISTDRQDLQNPIHIDLCEIREQTGAVRTELIAIGEGTAWLKLTFPDGRKTNAKAVLSEGKTSISCVADDFETAFSLKEKSSAFWDRQKSIKASAELMLAERQIFDEPKDEEEGVQEDGDLRVEWFKAYYRGNDTFKFRDEEYRVFDGRGNPAPPQVCLDFIFDVIERASGTWYKKRNFKPERTKGKINFYSIEGMNRRSIQSLLTLAAGKTIPIERYDIPKKEWISLKNKRLFANNLAKYADAMREGDILVIHGIREQDMEEHYHTALIIETDPLTGLPMVVADNQGRPRLGSLTQAMKAAPKRSVKHVLRIDYEKMEGLSSK